MYCKSCIKVNDLPKCVEPGGSIVLTGIVLPDNTEQELYAVFINHSSDRTTMFTVMTDVDGYIVETNGDPTNGLDVTAAYDLMNHSYAIEFLDKLTLEPVTITIDGMTACCIEFEVIKGLMGNGEYTISTGGCNG